MNSNQSISPKSNKQKKINTNPQRCIHEFDDSYCYHCEYVGFIYINCPNCNNIYDDAYICINCGGAFNDIIMN